MKRFSLWPTSLAVTFLLLASAAFGAGPLATAQTNWDGVVIDLTRLERRGNVLTVQWAVRSDAVAAQTVRFVLAGSEVRTYLVDEETGTKYYVLADQEGHSLASAHVVLVKDVYNNPVSYGIQQTIPPGSAKRLWAKFPAPPPEVRQISVYFDETEPLEYLPIADK